ncbi:MAG: J domain-containing protein [Hyphomicrobiales bacterium]|nr:J domain-containing protein [Hyphomicrobiales bacterium]MDE2114027.1 J domain-containing protein [Hyphomicrobiales bacterium]
MRNPYDVLAITKNASIADIKKAYRRLAKANHPDQNKDPKAKERFNEATQAYDLLSDEKKRGAFDRGEIDAEGKPKFHGFEGHPAGNHGRQPGFENFDFGGTRGFDASDIFADLFSGGVRPGGKARPARGQDIEASIQVSLEDVARGNSVRVSLPTGRSLDIKIPREIDEGKQIRLKGQGQPGTLNGPAGDLLIAVHFNKHPQFVRDGRDLRLELPIALYEAVLGAEIEVPTLEAPVRMKVPPGAHHGKPMRLRGKGMPGATPGDLYVTLKIVLPREIRPEFTAEMQKWRDNAPYNPR